jgi:hypothetical protein
MKKWIGLFQVKPGPGNDSLGSEAVGAFVNVVGLASTAEEFIDQATEYINANGFELTAYRHVGDLVERQHSFEVPLDVLTLASKLTDKNSCAFDVFHTFPLTDMVGGHGRNAPASPH